VTPSGYPQVVATPEPRADAPTVAELEAELRALRAHTAQVERELETASRELERVKLSRSWRATEPLRAAKARLGGRG
jgi:LmbE family N-acetylglucosaminyl deacetylase